MSANVTKSCVKIVYFNYYRLPSNGYFTGFLRFAGRYKKHLPFLIIDNKAYSNGYSLPMSQADEMIRYIDENKSRDINRNPNKWWAVFPYTISDLGFTFVSSQFIGGFNDRIELITTRTGYKGGYITANLLFFSEKIKLGRLKYDDEIEMFKQNDEVKSNKLIK